MEVKIHYPASKESKEALNIKAAEIYSEIVKNYIHRLKCPKECKIKIIDELLKLMESN